MNIQELEDEMWKQVRNGRDEVYIKTQDLQELREVRVDTADNSRVFMKYSYVKQLIADYKEKNKKKLFRDSLKVEIQPEIVKNLIEKMDTAEQSMKIRNENQWEK